MSSAVASADHLFRAETFGDSWPSKLDNVSKVLDTKSAFAHPLSQSVAGGIPSGMAPFESLIKECHEEASLPEQVVRQRAK